jgi:hypothetical protein
MFNNRNAESSDILRHAVYFTGQIKRQTEDDDNKLGIG